MFSYNNVEKFKVHIILEKHSKSYFPIIIVVWHVVGTLGKKERKKERRKKETNTYNRKRTNEGKKVRLH